jgi:hypothetical protein
MMRLTGTGFILFIPFQDFIPAGSEKFAVYVQQAFLFQYNRR